MRLLLIFFLTAFLVQPTVGQRHASSCTGPADHATESTVAGADTLDWQRFFPLKVGNVWEYHEHGNGAPEGYFRRLEITADTSVDGWLYYEVQQRIYEPDSTFKEVTSRFWTYDTTRYAVSMVDSLGIAPIRGEPTYDQIAEEALNLDSGGTVGERKFHIGSTAFSRTARRFDKPGCTRHVTVFAYDLGPTYYVYDLASDMTLVERQLVYAKVGGEEFGGSIVGTNIEAPQHEQGKAVVIESVHPNPVSTGGHTVVSVVVQVPQPIVISLYDMLGRKRALVPQRYYGPGRHEVPIPVDQLAAGVYYIVAQSQNGSRPRTQSFVVAR